jgi:hypothetical protein
VANSTFTEDDLASLLQVADLSVPQQRHAMLAEQFGNLLQGALALNLKLQPMLQVPPITQFAQLVAEGEDQP